MTERRFVSRQQGFNLIELIVTISIVAILAALSSSIGSSLFKGHRLRNASMDLVNSIVVARSEAIKRGADVAVTPVVSSDWASGWNVTVVSSSLTIQSRTRLDGVVITNGPSSIVFKNTGRLAQNVGISSMQISLVPDDVAYRKCIRLDLSGLPRSIDGAC